jgi:molecular chaperone DnaK (HSP70)
MSLAVVGVDLGTTNSCVSIIDKDIPKCLYFAPTCISFDDDQVIFGELHNSSERCSNFKRLIGVSYKDYQNNALLQECFNTNTTSIEKDDTTGLCCFVMKSGKRFSVNTLVEMFYKHLYDKAQEIMQSPQNLKAVITVPIHFSDFQKKTMMACATSAGFNVLKVMSEPSAACLAYQTIPTNQIETILVIDCGGGTTDLSVISIDNEDNILEAKEVVGNNFLGGEDLTNTLFKYVFEKFGLKTKPRTQDALKMQCEKVKKELSFCKQSTIYLEELDLSFKVSRSLFEDLNKRFFQNLKEMLSKISIAPLRIILVGGTTRIPKFVDVCRETCKEICNTLDPDKTVSIGAAMVFKNNDIDPVILIDVLPLSLGVNANGGLMVPIISKNTPYPISRTRTFMNDQDYLETIDIDVYQGNHRFVKNNILLGKFQLSHPMFASFRKGEIKLNVTFTVDGNGLLQVTASYLDKTNIDVAIVDIDMKKVDIDKHIEEASHSKWC